MGGEQSRISYAKGIDNIETIDHILQLHSIWYLLFA